MHRPYRGRTVSGSQVTPIVGFVWAVHAPPIQGAYGFRIPGHARVGFVGAVHAPPHVDGVLKNTMKTIIF